MNNKTESFVTVHFDIMLCHGIATTAIKKNKNKCTNFQKNPLKSHRNVAKRAIIVCVQCTCTLYSPWREVYILIPYFHLRRNESERHCKN